MWYNIGVDSAYFINLIRTGAAAAAGAIAGFFISKGLNVDETQLTSALSFIFTVVYQAIAFGLQHSRFGNNPIVKRLLISKQTPSYGTETHPTNDIVVDVPTINIVYNSAGEME